MTLSTAIKDLETENARLSELLRETQNDLSRARERVGALEGQMQASVDLVKNMMAERDHYMRLSTELMNSASNAATILSDVAARASHGQYRPNGGVAHERAGVAVVDETEESPDMQRIRDSLKDLVIR